MNYINNNTDLKIIIHSGFNSREHVSNWIIRSDWYDQAWN